MKKISMKKKEAKSAYAYAGDGVSLSSIYKKKDVAKKRKCLMCGKMFNSKGTYNRRCRKCDHLIDVRHKNSFYQQSEYKVSFPQDDTLEIFEWFKLDYND